MHRRLQINLQMKQCSFKHKYQRLEFLGRGTFGQVYKIRDRETHRPYAAKIISLAGLSEKEILRADEERLIHSQLSHPNILKFVSSYLEGQDLIFVMQYCQYGDLQGFIRKRKESGGEHLPEEVVMNIFIQLLFGLQYLHGQGIVHRDIKPSNIFVDGHGAVKIADFGISKMVNPAKTLQILSCSSFSASQGSCEPLHLSGTPLYSSPQTCRNEPLTPASDIWSLGCVLYQLCTLEHAFDATNILALATMINSKEVADVGAGYREDLGALLRWMMEKRGGDRPGVGDVLGLTFIKKYIRGFEDNRKQQEYTTPTKKISYSTSLTSTCSSPQKSLTPPTSPYPIIYNESQLQQQQQQPQLQQQQQYFIKLKQSCLNLLGVQAYEQMYHEIRELCQEIVIVNEKDKGRLYGQLRNVYGQEYYELAKAVYQLVRSGKGG